MLIWIFVAFIPGILASAGSTDSSVFVLKRGGLSAKDTSYSNKQYNPDSQYGYQHPQAYLSHHDFGPRPHDNGQEPSTKREVFTIPELAEGPSRANQLKNADVSSRLAAILPLIKFNCHNHVEGYYADVDFGCTVFHYCNVDKSRHTFMCLGDRKFNEKYLTCEYQQTNCSKAFSEAVESERIRRWNLNSRVDNFSEPDELPELIRTKRIGNDFAVSDIFSRGEDKYDPLRFKRSSRKRRSTPDSNEDLLAMSSEPLEDVESGDFAGRVGSFFTDNQWRSTGINLPNRRRSFSPYQAPRQAVNQNRQALHSFRQDGTNVGNEQYRRTFTASQLPFQDYGSYEAQTKNQDYLRPEREISSQKPTKTKKSHIEDDEVFGNAYENYEKPNSYPIQGNYRPNIPLTQPPSKPKQYYEPQTTPSFGQPFPFDNFFNPPEQRPRFPSTPPAKQIVPEISDDEFLPSTQAPYEEPQPKPKKKKKRPQHDQYDEYVPPTQAESPKVKVFHEKPVMNKPARPGYYLPTEPETTGREELLAYNEPADYRTPLRTERPFDLPFDTNAKAPKINQFQPRPQPLESTLRPFQYNIPQEGTTQQSLREGFPVSQVANGVKKFTSHTFAPVSISTIQPTARQNQPSPFPQQDHRPPKPWPQKNTPIAPEFPIVRNNEEPHSEVGNDYKKYYQPLAINEPKFGDYIPKTENRKPSSINKETGNGQKERRKESQTQPIDSWNPKEEKVEWASYAQQPASKAASELRAISDIGQEYRGIVSKKQDHFHHYTAVPKAENEASQRQSDANESQIFPERTSKPQKKRPDSQNLSQLSWASIFHNAESYESHEDQTQNEGFHSSRPVPVIFIEPTTSTKRPKLQKSTPQTTTTTSASSATEDIVEENNDNKHMKQDPPETSESSRVDRISSYKKRIESQREQARQKVKTTTTPNPNDDVDPESPLDTRSEIQETERQKPILDVESPKSESQSRVKFPQRTRVRSRPASETPPEKDVLGNSEVEKVEIAHDEEISSTTTTTTTTQSSRKSFDLNKFRTSNKFNFPRLRRKDDDTPTISGNEQDNVDRSKKDDTEANPETSASEIPESADTGEPSRRRPGRKRMGGYRRRTSTTPDSLLQEDKQEQFPTIEEITENAHEEKPKKKYVRKEFTPKVSETKQQDRNNEKHTHEETSTTSTSTEPIKEEITPTTQAEDRSDKEDLDETNKEPASSSEVLNGTKEEKNTDIEEESAETLPVLESTPAVTENSEPVSEEKPRDLIPNSSDEEKPEEPIANSSDEEKPEEPIPNSSDEDGSDLTQVNKDIPSLKPETTSDFSTSQAVETETNQASKESTEVGTATNPEVDTDSKEKTINVNVHEVDGDSKDPSSEEIIRKSDLNSEATSVNSTAKDASSEENGSQVQHSVEISDFRPVKTKKRTYSVTMSPKYVTMATHDPILPIEELLPLLPRDNGRGM